MALFTSPTGKIYCLHYFHFPIGQPTVNFATMHVPNRVKQASSFEDIVQTVKFNATHDQYCADRDSSFEDIVQTVTFATVYT